MTPGEQSRLQVLSSLLAEHMTLDQAAALMGVSPRHTRRILEAYRGNGAALARGLRGRKPPDAIPEPVRSRMVHLAATIYQGANHSSIGAARRTRGHRHRQDHPAAHPGRRRSEQSKTKTPAQAPGTPPAHAPGGNADTAGRQSSPLAGRGRAAVRAALRRGRRHRRRGGRSLLRSGDSLSYFRLLQGLIRRRSIPLALHTDRHPVFKHRSEYQPAGTAIQSGRALDELGMQLMFALSPQAKGRVERRLERSRTG